MIKHYLFLLICAILGIVNAFRPMTSRIIKLPSTKLSTRKSSQLSMNMLGRFFRVVKSNINSVLSSLEDPEKVVEQAVNDMQNDLIKVRQSYAEVSATHKRIEKQKVQADSQAQEWYRRAQLALQKGDEELAREALTRRQAHVDTADAIGKQLGMQVSALDKLYNSMTALETKITEAKRQKDVMIARARTAKTTTAVTDMLSNISSGSNSVAAFDRMKEKVESLEVQADVAGQLAASSGTSVVLEEKFKALDSNTKVEDELAMMKRQLPAGMSQIAQLPSSEYIDVEYENLKRDMGRS